MQADPSASPHAGLRGPHPAYAQTIATGDGTSAHGSGLAHATSTAIPGGAGGVQHARPYGHPPQQAPARVAPAAVALRGAAPGSTVAPRSPGTIVTGQYLPTGDAGIDRMRRLEFALKLHGTSY